MSDLFELNTPKFEYISNKSKGTVTRTVIGNNPAKAKTFTTSLISSDAHADFDLAVLKSEKQPITSSNGELKVIDLFSGCGGLSAGAMQAADTLGLSIHYLLSCEISPIYAEIYKENFSPLRSIETPIEEIFSSSNDPLLTQSEQKLLKALGESDLLMGGPPCQGHSDLNNHTRREDPRNDLYFQMARAATIFRPKWVIIENVLGVKHSKNKVVARTISHLKSLDYHTFDLSLNAADFGVAQNRKRHFTVASKYPLSNFEHIISGLRVSHHRPVSWAINDLKESYDENCIFDSSASHSKTNRERIEYLFENSLFELPNSQRPDCHRLKPHSYKSVYGRLYPDKPAPTITSGFGSTGQGRFVHPTEKRTLTPHEAARVQSFPDWFRFGSHGRRILQQTIGNAVPPKLAECVIYALITSSNNL